MKLQVYKFVLVNSNCGTHPDFGKHEFRDEKSIMNVDKEKNELISFLSDNFIFLNIASSS